LKCDNKGDSEQIDLLDGIIRHLTRQCGGNVHHRNVVTVTSSEAAGGPNSWYSAPYVTASDRGAYLHCVPTHPVSGNWVTYRPDEVPHARNTWVCYDFKDRRIIPTSYAICAGSARVNSHHLKNWVVEVSGDGNKWTQIDTKEDNADLNGPHRVGTFPVTTSEPWQFIRLVNIGRNWFGNDSLYLSMFEIFGSLIG
jgi:hypothetical protein